MYPDKNTRIACYRAIEEELTKHGHSFKPNYYAKDEYGFLQEDDVAYYAVDPERLEATYLAPVSWIITDSYLQILTDQLNAVMRTNQYSRYDFVLCGPGWTQEKTVQVHAALKPQFPGNTYRVISFEQWRLLSYPAA
jgi:hypothetical protein